MLTIDMIQKHGGEDAKGKLVVKTQKKVVLTPLVQMVIKMAVEKEALTVFQNVLLPQRTLSLSHMEALLPMHPSLFVALAASLVIHNRSAARGIHTRATHGSPY
jgi:hypothetical protein